MMKLPGWTVWANPEHIYFIRFVHECGETVQIDFTELRKNHSGQLLKILYHVC